MQLSGNSVLETPGYAKKATGAGAPIKISCSNSARKSIACSAKYGTRATGTLPTPLCNRAGKVSPKRVTPALSLIRPASSSVSSCNALPPSTRAVLRPLFSSSVHESNVEIDTSDRGSGLIRS